MFFGDLDRLAPWEAIVLIPFLDEDAMIAELTDIDHVKELTVKERQRNDVNASHRVSLERPHCLFRPPLSGTPRAT